MNLKFKLGLLVLAAFLVLPFVSGYNEFLIFFTATMLIFIAYSSAWNLLAYSGQGSLGHAAFLGIGGYVSAVLAGNYGYPPLLTIIIGGIAGAVVGLFVGALCVRLREWFLAMVTFGVPIISASITVTNIRSLSGEGVITGFVNSVIMKLSSLQSLLGSYDGLFPLRLVSGNIASQFADILSIITGQVFPKKIAFSLLEYNIILIFTVASIIFVHFTIRSKWGFAFAAIRNNEREAKTLGVNTAKYKLAAFVLSAFIASIAGGLLAHYVRYINPDIYAVGNSFNPVIYSVVGGLGTVEGPIIGTVLITILNEYLKQMGLTYLKEVIIGVIIVLTVIFVPRGLTSILESQGRKATAERLKSAFSHVWDILNP